MAELIVSKNACTGKINLQLALTFDATNNYGNVHGIVI